MRYAGVRLRRHVYWARTQGVRALVEEDRLNPADRARTAYARWRWRGRHGVPCGSATPVYVVGVQRSGTNMLVRGFEAVPEFEVHNENDRRVFHRYRLRPDQKVIDTVNDSRHRFVLFKPLCDSHRIDHLLALPGVPRGYAIWAYRNVDDRARSAVAKFGDASLEALRWIAAGHGEDIWQGRRLSTQTLEHLRRFDYDAVTQETAAALLWYARNSLYFDLALDRRPEDVFLCCYDALVGDPEGLTRRICDFLGLPWRPALSAHIRPRTPPRRPLVIDPDARALCDDMMARLDAAAAPAVGGGSGSRS